MKSQLAKSLSIKRVNKSKSYMPMETVLRADTMFRAMDKPKIGNALYSHMEKNHGRMTRAEFILILHKTGGYSIPASARILREFEKPLFANRKFRRGGSIMNKPRSPKYVEIHFNRNHVGKYGSATGDIDRDGLPNIDDPNPTRKGDKESIEETQLTDTINKIINLKKSLEDRTDQLTKDLAKAAPPKSKVYARVKSPYSILGKLVDKRMLDANNPKKGLTDIVGTTVSLPTKFQADEFAKVVRSGKFGEIIEDEDMYKDPKLGYRAFHFIVNNGGVPVEIQIKTQRMKEINQLSHKPYKYKNLDEQEMLKLTDIANRADQGDTKAAAEFERLMKNPDDITFSLYKDKTKIPKFKDGGSLSDFAVPTFKQQLMGDALGGDIEMP